MADTRDEGKAWWQTLPAILAGIAGVIGAITGLVHWGPGGGGPDSTTIIKGTGGTNVVEPCEAVRFSANDFAASTNIAVGTRGFGDGVITNSGDNNPNMVEFEFKAPRACTYRLEVEYAALESRPVVISLDGILVNGAGLSQTTGGWGLENQKWLAQGSLTAHSGLNKLKFERPTAFPHIRTLRLVPTE